MAYDFQVDGIYYNKTSDTTVEVTNESTYSGSYAGDISIPSSVTYDETTYSVTGIDRNAFRSCKDMISVTIPETVEYLKADAFYYCTSLTSVSLPTSLKTIETSVFLGCEKLSSITLPESLTSIGSYAFEKCTSLTSIEIPATVTSLGDGVFNACTSLNTVILPSTFTSLSDSFTNCKALKTFICNAETLPSCSDNPFTFSSTSTATLYVPASAVDTYKSASYWKKFGSIKAIEDMACEAPVISYENGSLKFECETQDAQVYYTLTCPDVTTNQAATDNEVTLDACYEISAYAELAGIVQSSTATATLYFIKDYDDTTTGVISIKDQRGILVLSAGGLVTIKGLAVGETITYYDLSGTKLGTAMASDGFVSFNATPGSIIIVRTGDTSLKIAVKSVPSC